MFNHQTQREKTDNLDTIKKYILFYTSIRKVRVQYTTFNLLLSVNQLFKIVSVTYKLYLQNCTLQNASVLTFILRQYYNIFSLFRPENLKANNVYSTCWLATLAIRLYCFKNPK